MRRVSLLLVLAFVAGCLGPWAFVTPPDGRATSPAAAANQFALDLYGTLGGGDGNVFFSPSCIREAFAMTHAGARGETAAEMATALRLPNDPARARRETAALRPRVGPLSRVQLRQAASLWGQRGYGFQRSFLSSLGDGYGANVHEVDFKSGDVARKTINAWVERQTADRIKDLFPPRSLSPQTRLVLVSAIYFTGDWVHKFSKESTQDDTFFVTRERKTRAPLMHQTETFGYAEADGCQVLQMPYVGREVAMLVVLPREVDGLAALERSLTAESLAAWTARLQERKVRVTFPRFQMDHEFDLTGVMTARGMRLAFQPGAADFSGMNGGQKPLHVSAAVHKAWIELNELGTEVAAATGVAVSSLAMSTKPDPIPVFRADHPFLFALRDLRTGAILFLGRYVQP